MHRCYRDILDRIADPPSWFDDYGVPRYSQFSPTQLSNIFANEAALAEVSCQSCGRRFRVALTGAFADRGFSLGDEIRLHRVSYGDPPNVECCGPGLAMGSVMHEVLQYWFRNDEIDREWRRDPTLEGSVSEEWLDPPDTVAEVMIAVGAGATKVLVVCTSRQNRFVLAGRIATAISAKGRVVVTYPDDWAYKLAGNLLKDHVPDADIGSLEDNRQFVLLNFNRINNAGLTRDDSFIIIAAPPLKQHPRTVKEQDDWEQNGEPTFEGA